MLTKVTSTISFVDWDKKKKRKRNVNCEKFHININMHAKKDFVDMIQCSTLKYIQTIYA